ncbi:RNA polymerase sigma-70 factor [Aquimarina sp. MMG016]|uniref:RNA polymerase sigma-70 factor n=1 Tax=Aquimarina sp. MMG016 TaxID=2822690 RepID=UPI001B3A2982|nr:RNA polymerase sigma-70 factor [Aquimarina sp. MMG016]MBQ4822141.1 RNA polymerase sigma-70 factor [Aquimarina sp. MMG016]
MNSYSSSFENSFHEHYPMVVKTAYYVVNEVDLAEDISQEVFVKLWEVWNRKGQIENLQAYLRTTTKNLALTKLYQKKRLKIREQQYATMYFVEGESETFDVPASFLEELQKSLDQLPPRCRLVFSMSRFEGLSNDEIAEELQVSKRTVETQISAALKHLRQDFKGRQGDFFPAVIPLLLLSDLFL